MNAETQLAYLLGEYEQRAERMERSAAAIRRIMADIEAHRGKIGAGDVTRLTRDVAEHCDQIPTSGMWGTALELARAIGDGRI